MTSNRTRSKDLSASPSPHSASGLEHSLVYRLYRLYKLTDLSSQRHYPESTGLSLSDGRCLAIIAAFGPVTVNELAQRLVLNKGQASRSAQWLVDQGLVRKAVPPEDGRAVSLELTAAGRRVWKKVQAAIDTRGQDIFGGLSESEAKQLGRLFNRLIERAEKTLGNPGLTGY